jgi:hypothetical protein
VERGGYLQRKTPLKTKTRLRIKGISETAELKDEIQCLVRDIVIIRDGGCILRNYPGHKCSGFRNDGELNPLKRLVSYPLHDRTIRVHRGGQATGLRTDTLRNAS